MSDRDYQVFLADKGYYSGTQRGWAVWSFDPIDAMNLSKDEAERIAATYRAQIRKDDKKC